MSAICYCQVGTKFHVWIFTATHKSDPGSDKYLCACQVQHTTQHSAQHIADIATFPRKNLGDKNKHLHLYPGFLSITRVKISWFQVTFNFWMISASFVRCHQAEWGVKTRLLRRGPDRVCGVSSLGMGWRAEEEQRRSPTNKMTDGKINLRYHKPWAAIQSRGKWRALCRPLWGGATHGGQCLPWCSVPRCGRIYSIDLTILLNNAWK